MKHVPFAMLAIALLLSPACKKKDAELAAPVPEGQSAKAADTEAAPTGPAIPEVALTGTASENLVAVFEAGTAAIENAPDAQTAAAIVTGMLAKYDVAELRAKSKAAKAAGQGASAETLATFKELKARYAKASTKLDSEAFGQAAKAWAKAWGLN